MNSKKEKPIHYWNRKDIDPVYCRDECCAGRFGGCVAIAPKGKCPNPNPDLINQIDNAGRGKQKEPRATWGQKAA